MPPKPVPTARRPPYPSAIPRAAATRLIGALLVLLLGSVQAAELLDVPGSVTLPADGALSLTFAARDARTLRVQLERSPLGVELESAGGNRWTLGWDVPERRFDSTVVLNVSPADDPAARERFTIELRAPTSSGSGSGTERTGRAGEVAPAPEPRADAGGVAPLALPEIAPQTLVVGQPWELWLRAEGLPPESVDLALRGARPGLTLTAGNGGWHRLAYTPLAPGVIELDVVATARRDAMVETRRRVRLNVKEGEVPTDARQAALEPPDIGPPDEPEGLSSPEPGMERSLPAPRPVASADAPAPPDPESDALAAADPESGPENGPEAGSGEARLERLLAAPTLRSMSNHVVSAGRAVRFRVRPRVDDGQRAIVQIDRLPRNASFDENDDGSRTFHWPTADRDQGEHRFRLTAINAEDASLRDEIEVTVIVGDPSRGKTVPAEPQRR